MTEKDKLQEPVSQRSYLLRVWREDDQSPWRASLQSIATGERRGFGNLEAMLDFLKRQESRLRRCDN